VWLGVGAGVGVGVGVGVREWVRVCVFLENDGDRLIKVGTIKVRRWGCVVVCWCVCA
jgi:hypothetical protein